MQTFRATFVKSIPITSSIYSVTILKIPSNSFAGIAKNSKYSSNSSPDVCISIISEHIKNHRVDQARAFFDKIPFVDVYLSTKMICCYVQVHRLDEALELFGKMPVKDIVMWNLMVKGCIDCGDLELGLKIFDQMLERNVISWTTVINGLLRFGRVDEAESLFRVMPVRDVAVWNALLHGYFENGRVEEAVRLFEEMPQRNVITWTTMIGGLDQHGMGNEALSAFKKMVASGIKPTSSTFSSVLTACANVSDLCLGTQVHGHVMKFGYLFDVYITASLISFYANCKQMDYCIKAYNEKMHMNVVVWTSLLTGYAVNNKHEDALEVFGNMIRMKVIPNQSSFTSALNSVCEMEALDWGKEIHGAAIKMGLGTDTFVGNTLVVLYTKCGNIKDGLIAFKEISDKNIVSWNSIIVGCAQHGCGKWALLFFSQMVTAGVSPDDITFTGLLNAFSHSGMLREGRYFFDYLTQCQTIEVKLEHYACMVDILCRSGKLDEAEALVEKMPMKANLSIWLALLGGCRKSSNLGVAESVAKKIFKLDPQCTAAYVLMSNIYAVAGKWNDVARIRGILKRTGGVKEPGRSWVIQKGRQHAFVSGDKSHPFSEKIYEKLDWLQKRLKEFGYVPDQRYALHDVEDEQKEAHLSYHSERLAICYALISTSEHSPITVMKNLRVCGDCHSAIKLIAKIVQREIVLRDSSRFHHFRDGFCSCGDYW